MTERKPNIKKQKLTIYCEQYGYYWKFTPEEFLSLCNKSIQNKPDGFELPRKNELKRIPVSCAKGKGEPHRRSYSCSHDVILFHPLDWDRGDYSAAAREVIQRIREMNQRQSHMRN